MLVLSVELKKDVVLLLGVRVIPTQLYLPLCQVGRGLHGFKNLLIFRRDHNRRFRRVDVRRGIQRLKEPAHALELVRDMAALFFIRVGDHGKVRAAHFNPLIGTSMSRATHEGGD